MPLQKFAAIGFAQATVGLGAEKITPIIERVGLPPGPFSLPVCRAIDRGSGGSSGSRRIISAEIRPLRVICGLFCRKLNDPGLPRPVESQKATLPLLATANDLRELIHYLKKHPDGVTIVEALGEVKKRILDPRKISAYEAWGVVDRQGDWLKLSDLGWEFSRKLAAEAALFRSILDRVEPYRTVLELAHSQQLKLITQEDIARFWRAHYSDTLTMRRSDAGLFVVTQEDCQLDEQGSWMLKPEVQAEISAAYLFYNRHVLLLWDERVPVPSDWQNITRCTFVGEELTWEMGLQLAKALLAFKR